MDGLRSLNQAQALLCAFYAHHFGRHLRSPPNDITSIDLEWLGLANV